MEPKIVKLELNNVHTTPIYGGTSTTVTYDITTDTNGILNHYEIEAEIRGIASGQPFMQMMECTPTTNNEETLTQDAIESLLDW